PLRCSTTCPPLSSPTPASGSSETPIMCGPGCGEGSCGSPSVPFTTSPPSPTGSATPSTTTGTGSTGCTSTPCAGPVRRSRSSTSPTTPAQTSPRPTSSGSRATSLSELSAPTRSTPGSSPKASTATPTGSGSSAGPAATGFSPTRPGCSTGTGDRTAPSEWGSDLMSGDSAIRRFRRSERRLMTSTVEVTRVTGPPSYDPDTGTVTEPTSTVYSGDALVRMNAWEGSDVQAGDTEVRLRTAR